MNRSTPDRAGARRRRLAEGLLLVCALLVALGVAALHGGTTTPVAAARVTPSPSPTAAAKPTATTTPTVTPGVTASATPTGTVTPEPTATVTPTTTASVTPSQGPPGPAEQVGHHVYLRDCAWCHGTDGGGSGRAPSLKTDGPADADFWLRTGRMPLASADSKVKPGAPAYDSKTLDALVSYVGSLGTGDPIPKIAPGDKAIGEDLFISNCAPCHSSSGTGMILPDGTWAPTLYSTPREQIAEAIRIGPGQMPRFSKDDIDQEELNGLVSYVDDLGSPQVIGGHPLDQLGPIAEGIFFFLLPLPLLVVVIRLLGKKAP
jgi:ubiquinol-cytochrome c reductase cytochrome c subunit